MYHKTTGGKVMYLAALILVFIAITEGLAVASHLEVYPELINEVSKNNTHRLYFGLMLSLSGDQQRNGALAGVQAALDDINSRDDLLPGFSLHYTLTDSEACKPLACMHVPSITACTNLMHSAIKRRQ